MARVPTYERQVTANPVDGTKQQANVSPDAFGAAQGRALQGLGNQIQQTGNVLAQHAQRLQAEYDESVITGVTNDADERARDMFDKYEQLSGKDAVDNHDAFAKDYEDMLKTVAKDLSPRQARIWERISSQKLNSGLNRAASHNATQRRVWHDQEDTARLKNLTDNAVGQAFNDHEVGLNMELGKRTVRAMADRNGWDDEMTKRSLAEYETNLHKQVITARLATNPASAREYFNAHKKEILGGVRADLEEALKEGTIREQSQALMMKYYSDELGAQDIKAGIMESSAPQEVKDAAWARAKDEISARDAQKAEEKRFLYDTSAQYADDGKRPPAEIWTKLSTEEQANIERRRQMALSQVPVVHNPEAWYEFMVRDDRYDIDIKGEYGDKFDQAHMERALADQASAHAARTSNGAGAAGQSYDDRIISAFVSAGLLDNPKKVKGDNAKRVSLFADNVDRLIRELEGATGRKARPDEVQSIIDQEMLKAVYLDKSWKRDPLIPAGSIGANELSRIYVKDEAIPAEFANGIYAFADGRGIDLSTEDLANIYARHLAGDRSWVKEYGLD